MRYQKKIIPNAFSEIKKIIPEVMPYVSYFDGVRKLCAEMLKEVLDEMFQDEDYEATKLAQDVVHYGINIRQKWKPKFAKEYKNYVQLTNHAQVGRLKNQGRLERTYKLPNGYFYAGKRDIPKSFQAYFNQETHLIEDPKTTLKAGLFTNKTTGEVVLAFSGTEIGWKWRTSKGWLINILQTMGYVPTLFEQAQMLAKAVNDKYPEKLIITGHSQGGGLAQYAGILLCRPTICINSIGLAIGVHDKLIEQLGNRKKLHEKACKSVTHIYLEGEFVSKKLLSYHNKANKIMGGFPLGTIYCVEVPLEMEKTNTLKRHLVATVCEVLDQQAENA